MTRTGFRLLAYSLFELIRYDLIHGIFGFGVMHRNIPVRKRRETPAGVELEACAAFNCALVAYPKRVMCLQSSVALARLLGRLGLEAQVVIGCRPQPFLGHAWVELDGVILNDSAGYSRQLLVLDRI